jgi:hypothetical protein
MYQTSDHFDFGFAVVPPESGDSDIVQYTVYGLRALACRGEVKRARNPELKEFYRQLSNWWKVLAASR